MRIVSVNIGKRITIVYNGKEEETGIYKYPVEGSIFLGKQGVIDDHVVDRRYHGGTDKACYTYGLQAYAHWKVAFPEVEMPLGMFGENLTIEGLDETKNYIGQVYKVGEAFIQVSQPRIPCYKLAIRFNDKRIVKLFQQSDFSGVYFRVLHEGRVAIGDELVEQENGLAKFITVAQVYQLFKGGGFNPIWLEKALNDPYLSESMKVDLRRK